MNRSGGVMDIKLSEVAVADFQFDS